MTKQIQQIDLKARRAPFNKFRIVIRSQFGGADDTLEARDFPAFLEARKAVDDIISYDYVVSVTVHNHDGLVVYSRSNQ